MIADAAWVLVIAHALSCTYELWRATAKAGVSEHDSMSNFVRQDVPLYVVAVVVIALLFANVAWAPWIGLAFSTVVILASIFFYNPRILPKRKPGLVDWFEDLTFTGLHFVAAALLIYEIT